VRRFWRNWRKKVSEDSESEIDSKEDPEDRHDRKTEQYLDLMYNTYISANEEYRKKLSKRTRVRERKEHAIPEDLTNFEKFSKIHEVEDELEFYDENPDNELLVTPQEEASSKKASIWFDANIFDDIEGENDDEEVINKMLQERQEWLKKRKRESLQASDVDSDQTTKKRKVHSEAPDDMTPAGMNPKKSNTPQTVPEDEDGFEEVPMEEKADDYSYDDPDEYDEQQRAEMLVLGSILKQSTQRAEVVDKTVNRYMYPDTAIKLPQWFRDDEDKHNKPHLPVTKEMVEEYKQQMKAIDARSTKKVAEAKARKKKKYVQKLEKARSKAKSIASNSELSERDKIKQIQKVYKGQLNKVKPSKVYVVGRKLVGSKIPRGKNVRIKLVDPRLKKDKRGKKASENRSKTKSKKRRKMK